MSTEQTISDGDSPYVLAPEQAAQVSVTESQVRAATTRKARQRSVYLFPAYGFTTALDIARRVEESGGGTLTEETLAVNMGLSVKSSGFRLKSLAARQFQLISKQGETLTTTPVAKAIFKPTSNEDAQRGYRQSFLSIPLFQAVSERYRGQRLPDSQTFRNVLEREFHVEHSRVQQAERMLLDSARDAQLLAHRGDGTYLVVSEGAGGALDELGDPGPGAIDAPVPLAGDNSHSAFHPPGPSAPTNTISFTLDEIGQLEEKDFEKVWRAIGILVRSRGSHRATSENDEDWDED